MNLKLASFLLGATLVVPMTVSTGANLESPPKERSNISEYRYRFSLGPATIEKSGTHSIIRFTLSLDPRTADDQKLIKRTTPQNPLTLVELERFVFTLYDGERKAIEPADLFPWETKKRIRFYLMKEESERESQKKNRPVIVVKAIFPQHVVKERPSILIEDTARDISAKITAQDKE
jgi:hypothetical protein